MLTVQLQKRRDAFNLALDFATADAGITALFGRSGCGKSTAINLIAGLLRPDVGFIRLDDEVLVDTHQRIFVPAEQRQIGYVFQDSRLFPHYTVRGNLDYGLSRARSRPQRIQFDTIVELLGLQQLLQRRPQLLSGGEKQRVALGRSLLAQPRLLLLDEPLASLDLMRRAEVLPYLERVRDQLKIPMIYVSHQFEEVLQLATHVVLMKDGRMLAHGDLPSISRRAELRELLGRDAMGAVVEGVVQQVNLHHGLAQVAIGDGHLNIEAQSLKPGQRVRMQLLARDLILAVAPPHGLSVRNTLQGHIVSIIPDTDHAVLVEVDVGGVNLVARITRIAADELQLRIAMPIWILVKAITLRSHVYRNAPADAS